MKKVKAFNVVITLAAFAALYFLLPNDKEISDASINKIEASTQSQRSITKKAYQHPIVKGISLHKA